MRWRGGGRIQSAENQRQKENLWGENPQNKNFTYRRIRMRIIPDFSPEPIQTKKEWAKIFKMLKEKKIPPM